MNLAKFTKCFSTYAINHMALINVYATDVSQH